MRRFSHTLKITRLKSTAGHQCAAASVAKMGTSGGTTTIGTLRSQDSHIVVKQKLWLWPHKAVWQFSMQHGHCSQSSNVLPRREPNKNAPCVLQKTGTRILFKNINYNNPNLETIPILSQSKFHKLCLSPPLECYQKWKKRFPTACCEITTSQATLFNAIRTEVQKWARRFVT